MRFSVRSMFIAATMLGVVAPAFADSVSVTTPNGTTIVNGQPCRVVARNGDANAGAASNSTTITTGPGGVSGSTTVSPGGSGSSVSVGSGSSSNGAEASSAAGSDCVIYHNQPNK